MVFALNGYPRGDSTEDDPCRAASTEVHDHDDSHECAGLRSGQPNPASIYEGPHDARCFGGPGRSGDEKSIPSSLSDSTPNSPSPVNGKPFGLPLA